MIFVQFVNPRGDFGSNPRHTKDIKKRIACALGDFFRRKK